MFFWAFCVLEGCVLCCFVVGLCFVLFGCFLCGVGFLVVFVGLGFGVLLCVGNVLCFSVIINPPIKFTLNSTLEREFNIFFLLYCSILSFIPKHRIDNRDVVN